MTLFQKYLKLDPECRLLGLFPGGGGYFCTPRGARVIGHTGVDGIHFCFVRGFGDMVFAVNPMESPGENVHAVAATFADFLRLVLRCGDTAAIEQAHAWDKAQFEAFLASQTRLPRQGEALMALGKALGLSPMEEPYAYIRDVDGRFDSSSLPFPREYYEALEAPPREVPPWKVYFSGNFWGHGKGERPGREYPIGQAFAWGGGQWTLASAYACAKGLVVDLYKRIEAEEVRAFLDRWAWALEGGGELPEETQERIQAENPFCQDIRAELKLNGRPLAFSQGCGVCWNPFLPEGQCAEMEAEAALLHYGLDREAGYVFHRCAFPWAGKGKPVLRELELRLRREPIPVPGPHFADLREGEARPFIHPVSGAAHTLHVLGVSREELGKEHLQQQNFEFPRCFTMLRYTLEPELPEGSFYLTDCAKSDEPRPKAGDPRAPEALAAAAVGIIGGADGPVGIFIGGSPQAHTACSALHFSPEADVEWRMVFRKKTLEDALVRASFPALGRGL